MRTHEGARALAMVLTLACIATVIAACTPGEPEETELQRMLVLLPPLPEIPELREAGVWFSNPAKVKKLHGFAEDATFEDVPEERRRDFLEAVRSGGLCPNVGIRLQPGVPGTQMDVGYDIFTVKHCIEGSGVTLMEDDFESHHVAESLKDLGYDADEYDGIATYHFNAENYPGGEKERELAERAGHVATPEEGTIIRATSLERLHAALDTWTGRADSLARDPRYAALARALGPVVTAVLAPEEDRIVGTAYQEFTKQKRYIILASTYATADEAEAEGRRLVDRLEMHEDAHRWQKIAKPQVTDFQGGATLKISVKLKDEAPGGIPGTLFFVWRD